MPMLSSFNSVSNAISPPLRSQPHKEQPAPARTVPLQRYLTGGKRVEVCSKRKHMHFLLIDPVIFYRRASGPVTRVNERAGLRISHCLNLLSHASGKGQQVRVARMIVLL